MSVFLGEQITKLGGLIKMKFHVKRIEQTKEKVTIFSED